ncbi:hypothetical protein ACSSS7_008060 [Eimeria intestinalis]
MTAAHHYPSRVLPSSEAARIPPLMSVTPFDVGEAPSLRNGTLGFKGTDLFKAPSGMQPTSTVNHRLPLALVFCNAADLVSRFRYGGGDDSSAVHALLVYVQLVERLHGRVSLLFLFDLGGQHSQLSDVAAWLRHLEQHDSFISAVYGPLFTSSVLASHQQEEHGRPPTAAAAAAARGGSSPELASTSFLCVDHAPVWLRPLTLRSMRRLSCCFNPLSPFHDYPRRLLLEGDPPLDRRQLLAAEYHELAALVGPRATAKTLVGSFLGYNGKWGLRETEALKRKRRDPFVTVLLVDRAARGESEGALGGEDERHQEAPSGPRLNQISSSSDQQQHQQQQRPAAAACSSSSEQQQQKLQQQ